MNDIKFEAKLQQAKTDAIQKYMNKIESKISHKKILKYAKNGKNDLRLCKFNNGCKDYNTIKTVCQQLSDKYPKLNFNVQRGRFGLLFQLMALPLCLVPIFITEAYDIQPVDVYVTWK
jgi:hypothetical protein